MKPTTSSSKEAMSIHIDVDDAFARRCAALIDQERTLIPSSTPPNKSGSR